MLTESQNKSADADLYQSVAFAAAFDCRRYVIVAFTETEAPPPDTVQIGEFKVSLIRWQAGLEMIPPDSELRLVREFEEWLAG